MDDKVSLQRCFLHLGNWYARNNVLERAEEMYSKHIDVSLLLDDIRSATFTCSSLGCLYSLHNLDELAYPWHAKSANFAVKLKNKEIEAKENCLAGCALISAGKPLLSLPHHHEHLRIAKEINDKDEEMRALANLGKACFMIENFKDSLIAYQNLFSVSKSENAIEMLTMSFGGMGKAHQAMHLNEDALDCFIKQLHYSKQLSSNPNLQAKALTNITLIYEECGKSTKALYYASELLTVCQTYSLKSLESKAYRFLGKIYINLGNYKEAIKFYDFQLSILEEASHFDMRIFTLCDIAYCRIQLGELRKVPSYYIEAIGLAESQNCSKEVRYIAYEGYGEYLLQQCNYSEALSKFEECLNIAETQANIEKGLSKKLAFCHEKLGNLEQAIYYFQEVFLSGKDGNHPEQMVEACNKLAQLYRAIGDIPQANVFERKGQALESKLLDGTDSVPSNLRELSKRAEYAMKSQKYQQALTFYLELLEKSQTSQEKLLEACSLAGLGKCYDTLERSDEAIKYYLKEILAREEMNDIHGKIQSLERLGGMFYKSGEYNEAKSYYKKQLCATKRANSKNLEANALGNMGKVLMKTQELNEAIEYFNHQLTIFDEDTNIGTTLEHAECCANLGDIYLELNNFPEALSCHTKHLALVQQISQPYLQIRAYGCIGHVHFGLGQYDDALMCFEKKQNLSRNAGNKENEMEVYGELASVYKMCENWHYATSFYKRQRDMAKKIIETYNNDETVQRFYCQALFGLSQVNFSQEAYIKALDYQKKSLEIAIQFGFDDLQMNSNEVLADIYEKLQNYEIAISYRKAELHSAKELGKIYHICKGLMGIGKCQFYRCNFTEASKNLREALTASSSLNNSYIEAKIRYYLGLVYFHLGEMESALISLQAVRPIIDTLLNMSYFRLVELLHMLENIFLTLELVFVTLDKPLDALVVADTKKTLHFVKHIIFRYKVDPEVLKDAGFFKTFLLTTDISKLIRKISKPTIIYSNAYDKLHIWLIYNGSVKFKRINLAEHTPTNRKLKLSSQASLSEESYLFTDFYPGLTDFLTQFRESIGVAPIFCQQKTPLSPLIPFLPLPNLTDSDSGSVSHSSVSSGSSKRSAPSFDFLPSMDICQQRLYEILIEPIEKFLPHISHGELTFILDRDLILVPFSLLSSRDITTPPLCEQYKLHFYLTLQHLMQVREQIIPPMKSNTDISHLVTIHSKKYKNIPNDCLNFKRLTQGLTLKDDFSLVLPQILSPPLVVASPHFLSFDQNAPNSWFMKPAAEKEARRVAPILKTKALIREKTNRKAILDELQKTDCVFYSGQIQWNMLHLIQLSESQTQIDKKSSKKSSANSDLNNLTKNLDKLKVSQDGSSNTEGSNKETKPSNVCNYSTLSISDLLKSDLSKIKLFSLSGHCLPLDSSSIDINDYVCFIYILLCSGIKSVFIPLWSSPDNSGRAFIMSFFESTSKRMRLSRAFHIAKTGVRKLSCFNHPIFWAGFTVIGQDGILKESDSPRSFQQLITLDPITLRSILAFLRNLMVEAESLMRVDESEPTIVPEADVIYDFSDFHCLRDIMETAGFVFYAGLPPEIPKGIIYPEHDDALQLKRTISYTEALLKLDPQILTYFRRLRNRDIIIYPLLRLFKLTLLQFDSVGYTEPTSNSRIMLNLVTDVYVWDVVECQELLSYIGFTLKLATETEVQMEILRHIVNPAHISCYITSLHALFGTEDKLPKIILDSHTNDSTL